MDSDGLVGSTFSGVETLGIEKVEFNRGRKSMFGHVFFNSEKTMAIVPNMEQTMIGNDSSVASSCNR